MKSLSIVGLFLFFCLGVNAGNQKVLIKDGKSDYRIVIPTKADSSEQRAASLLQHYLFKISGCTLPIVSDQGKESRKEIIIGKTNRHAPISSMEPDEFLITTQGTRLFILGGAQKGAIYGVISFLEKYESCRKYSPTMEIVPRQSTVLLPSIYLKDKPVCTFREINGDFITNKDYKDWMRLNDVDEVFARGYFVHTFERIIPRAIYFNEHPEYFALINGKRVHNQLCLSNPEVLRVAIERLTEEMKKQPDKKIWSVSQNDNPSYCQCPECSKVIAEEGSPSGPIIRFVNQIATHFPDKIISTLAYQYSRQAPKITKPVSNVQIMLCTIELNRSKPIATDPSSQSFMKDITDWGKISNHIFLWDYTVNFSHHVSPFPNLNTLQPNIQFFTQNKALENFQQSNTSSGHEFSELKSYLIAHLLWNPQVNTDSLTNEFLQDYYGAAAPWINRYINRLQQEVAGHNEALDIYESPVSHNKGYLSASNIDIYKDLFQHALEVVQNDSAAYQRVLVAQLPLQYAIMEIGKNEMFDSRGWYNETDGVYTIRPEMENILKSFAATCQANGVKSVNESGLSPAAYCQATQRSLDVQVVGNLAFRKPVTTNPSPSPRFSEGNPATLTNGVQGANDFKVHWLGWEACDFDLNLDLQKRCTPHEIKISALYDPKSWILLPHSVSCMTSVDGKKYKDAGTLEIVDDQQKEDVTHTFIFSRIPGDVRYIRFHVEGTHQLPAWHASEGGKSWVFLDEIVVR